MPWSIAFETPSHPSRQSETEVLPIRSAYNLRGTRQLPVNAAVPAKCNSNKNRKNLSEQEMNFAEGNPLPRCPPKSARREVLLSYFRESCSYALTCRSKSQTQQIARSVNRSTEQLILSQERRECSEQKKRAQTSYQRTSVANRADAAVSVGMHPQLRAQKQRSGSRRLPQEPDRLKPSNGRDRANFRRHHRHCPCGPGSNPGRIPDDRHAAQKALL